MTFTHIFLLFSFSSQHKKQFWAELSVQQPEYVAAIVSGYIKFVSNETFDVIVIQYIKLLPMFYFSLLFRSQKKMQEYKIQQCSNIVQLYMQAR